MLQVSHICKEYQTGGLVQKALDDVSLNFRDSEFVAILGPSGSGKTTLLNIIGGLDRYDSGDLIINGVTTKKYRDRDWDSYRNHTVGFVFQSYNLIPHQTVLANVELALTISGVGRAKRRQLAAEALEKVGLGEQMHKKPNQMSGGQMQRVAIARALVNDPDILLADEPTGALDSETSVQVMDLLKEVAQDRLVVMVTHNPELAHQYATRIVNLRDGKILSDTDPFFVPQHADRTPAYKNMGKASMSFLTALSLSFNNLQTKKARTLLTSFAGSIGIIGIALILALSTGVNDYIQSVEEDTLSEYPLEIQSTGFDLTSIMVGMSGGVQDDASDVDTASDDEVRILQVVTNMFSAMDSNDLTSLKEYFDGGGDGIGEYVNAIEYSYSVVPQIFRIDGDEIRQVNPDQSFSSLGLGSTNSSSSLMSSMMSTDVFFEMPSNESLYENQYEVMAGRWPEESTECVVVLTSGGGMSDFLLYTLGLRDVLELDEMIRSFLSEEEVKTPDDMGTYTYDDLLGVTFKLVDSAGYYEYDEDYGVWIDKTDNEEYMKRLVEDGEDLTIVGVVQPAEGAKASALSAGIAYPASLATYVAERAADSGIVKEQLAHPDTDVFTGKKFGEEDSDDGFSMESLFDVDEEALEDAFSFDEDAFSGLDSSLDLSGFSQLSADSFDFSGMMDFGSISMDFDGVSLDLGDLLSDVDVQISAEGLGQLAQSLAEGYQLYAAEHPEADYSGLSQDFSAYLKTDSARAVIAEEFQELWEKYGQVTVTEEEMRALLTDILTGYQQYAAQMGYTDPDSFDGYLIEYLATGEAQARLTSWINELLDKNSAVEIAPEDVEEAAARLADGYLAYAAENGLPDVTKMGEYFIDYLNSEDGKERVTAGIAGVVDLEAIEEALTSAIEDGMAQAAETMSASIGQTVQTQVASVMSQVVEQLSSGTASAMAQAMTRMTEEIGERFADGMTIDADALAGAFQMNMDEEDLTELLVSLGTKQTASYDGNLEKLGYADFGEPTEISIYPKNFDSKEEVIRILDEYNARMQDAGENEKVISYTDVVGTLMSSVTDIIDTISYVLIAFVAISLVVSSIMIGVITYISVLERKKEIGILRAIGASKRNVSQVFNAETFIIGLCAGLLGIGLSLLLLIPGNALIHYLAQSEDISAALPLAPSVVLILLSVLLTILGGLIPAGKAAKSDPVTALRTE